MLIVSVIIILIVALRIHSKLLINEASELFILEQGEPVFFKKRTYQREGYVSVALEVSLAQQRSVRDYCKRRSAAGVRFDRTGMYFAYFPVQLWTSEVSNSYSKSYITRLPLVPLQPPPLQLLGAPRLGFAQ